MPAISERKRGLLVANSVNVDRQVCVAFILSKKIKSIVLSEICINQSLIYYYIFLIIFYIFGIFFFFFFLSHLNVPLLLLILSAPMII